MKSIREMELENKFNKKIKYREKKIKNQRMIIGKQQEEIERLNNIRNKAIEYLKQECLYDGKTYCDDLWCGDIPKLVAILKGTENNES